MSGTVITFPDRPPLHRDVFDAVVAALADAIVADFEANPPATRSEGENNGGREAA
jgi:hypothetical protein